MTRSLFLVLFFITALPQSALAQCQNNWLLSRSQTLALGSSAEFRFTRFENGEGMLFVAPAGETPRAVLFTHGAFLVKGFAGSELEGFVREQLQWLPMVFSPPTMVLMQAIPDGPCAAAGINDLAINLDGNLRIGDRKLMRAAGKVVSSRPGEIAYDLSFSTEPELQNGQAMIYSGTMSFSKLDPAIPVTTDVSGYSVVRADQETFVAPVATSLAQLRALLAQQRVK